MAQLTVSLVAEVPNQKQIEKLINETVEQFALNLAELITVKAVDQNMKTVTLEEIENKQTELIKLIAKFKSQQHRIVVVPAITMELSEGEHYAGIILDDEGKPTHHLILLPGDRDDIKWKDATAWAETLGGTLPTRAEQSLLHANLKGQFEQRYYWSSEAHASGSDYAWYQNFGYGYQDYYGTTHQLRARAVRRVAI